MADTDPAAAERRAGPWVVRLLAHYGIEVAFGIPGVHTVALYEGLATGALTHVTPRHEQGAGFMADGYARVAGKPAACFVITGPGLTNVATAMAQAYAESVPMLVLSSVSHRRDLQRGLGRLHELPDQRALASQVAAFSHTLQDLRDLPQLLDRAFAVFESGRPRPVHLEIPLDVWEQAPPPARFGHPRARVPHPAADQAQLDAAASALAAANRPVILAGGGAVLAAPELRQLANTLDAPVVMTSNARGLLAPDDPLAVPASPGLDAVRALIAESDAVLAVGTELGQTDYDMYETGMPALPGPLIRIDLDAAQMTRPQPADVALLGDAAATLGALAERLTARPGARKGGQRAEAVRRRVRGGLDAGMAKALAVVEALRDALPEALLVGDSTQPVYAGNLAFAAPGPGQWFNSATGYGTLGWALPASLGASLAAPARPVVCLIGDGGLHYTLGELASIREAGRPVILLLWNNAGYGEIKAAMQAQGIAPVGVDLFTPDFDRLAEAYGYALAVPERVDQLPEMLQAAARRAGPTLIRLEETVALA